jgi:hypothetical protein
MGFDVFQVSDILLGTQTCHPGREQNLRGGSSAAHEHHVSEHEDGALILRLGSASGCMGSASNA